MPRLVMLVASDSTHRKIDALILLLEMLSESSASDDVRISEQRLPEVGGPTKVGAVL